MPQQNHAMHAIVVSTCKSDMKRRILEALVSYGYYLQVKEILQQGGAQQRYKDFKLEYDGILMNKNRVNVPN